MANIFRNVTSNWFGIVVNIALSFFLAPLTVNALGNIYYGIWTLLMQFTGYLWLFDFGVRESVIKYVAQHHAADEHEQLGRTVHTAVSLYSVVALVTLLASAGLAAALPYVFNIPPDAVSTARWTTILAGATVAQGFVFNVFVGVLMGLQRFYVMAQIGVVFGVIRAVIVAALLLNGYGLLSLALVQFGMTLASNLLVYRLAIAQLPYLSVRLVVPTREDAGRLLHYGKYVLISNIGDKIVFATDSLVIGMFMPISALTYFAIGGSLIDYFRSFITSMASILNPLSSSLDARKQSDTVATVVLTGTKSAMLIGLPVCIGFIFLGRSFIGLWMGPEYAEPAGAVLAVLAVGHMIGLPYYSISGVLYGLGKHRIIAHTRLFEGAANLILSIALVRSYGLVGVAIGTVIPHIIVVAGVLPAMLPSFVPLQRAVYYRNTYLRTFAAAAPFALACYYVASVVRPDTYVTFFASVAFALGCYAIPCWFVGLTRAERGFLSASVRRRLLLA